MTSRLSSMSNAWLRAIPLLLLLGACASPTPYVPADGGYGYKEQQLETNRYRVTFAGNPSTPRETVQNYLLYRSAELTVENGFDYFTVVDRDVERSTRYYNQGYGSSFGYDDFGYDDDFPRRRFGRRLYHPRYRSTTSYPVSEYSSNADILMAKGEKPADDPKAYDALDVLQQLQSLIRRDIEN